MVVDVVDLNQRISACGRSQMWRGALHILETLQPMLRASLISFNAALRAFSSMHWCEALCLHRRMLQLSVKEDIITANSSGQALDDWQIACNLMEATCRSTVRVSQTSFGVLLNSQKAGQAWERAVGTFSSMNRVALQSNEIICSSAVHASSVVWETALAVMNALTASTQPNIVCFSSLSSTLDRKGTWKKALSLVHAAMARNVKLNKFLHNTACSSCSKVARWENAVQVQEDMASRQLKMDVVGSTSIISSMDAPCWRSILALLGRMCNSGIQLNNFVFNAAGDGLVKSTQWNMASWLLHAMYTRRMEMDVFTHSLAWTGYRRSGGQTIDFLSQFLQSSLKPNKVLLSNAITLHKERCQWAPALAIFSYMSIINTQPDLISHSDVIGACCSPRWQVGFHLWFRMCTLRVETDVACIAQILDAAAEQQATCVPELAERLDACATSLYAASQHLQTKHVPPARE
ncbi:EMB2654 [Symbiodinium natans]|uniref:EMB2654 protein n=1 Tax=Symbiodinium natans TaxID=878477 RepID=A0A812ICM2_9DINO|nr:EMB2654 [Symbiodinium natans]